MQSAMFYSTVPTGRALQNVTLGSGTHISADLGELDPQMGANEMQNQNMVGLVKGLPHPGVTRWPSLHSASGAI